MGHKQGVNREQFNLFPPTFDDLIPAEHPVRVIDGFVDGLDLAELGFAKALAKATGAPPYHPGDLLKLHLYGYLNRISSSRGLERECLRNLELMWLLKRLSPDHKTIAEFRRTQGVGVRQVCRSFVRWCQQLGVLKGEVVAVDGSKFAASNSLSRNVGRKQLEKRLARLDEKIDAYLAELDAQDAAGDEEPVELQASKTAEALDALKDKRAQLTAWVEQLKHSGEAQLSLTDAEARRMKQGMGGGFVVGYNVQIAVDTDTHLVVCQDVVNEGNDRQQLAPMAERVQQALGEEARTLLVDTGYANAEQAAQCAALGVTPVGPREHGRNRHGAFFDKRAFTFDATTDTYTCPAGDVLTYRGRSDGQRQYRARACGQCPLKGQCTDSAYRTVTRSEHEAAIEAMDQRARENPELMQKRKSSVEHVFGWSKESTGRRFLTRGLKSVGTELALRTLAYNLKRLIGLLGLPTLLKALHA